MVGKWCSNQETSGTFGRPSGDILLMQRFLDVSRYLYWGLAGIMVWTFVTFWDPAWNFQSLLCVEGGWGRGWCGMDIFWNYTITKLTQAIRVLHGWESHRQKKDHQNTNIHLKKLKAKLNSLFSSWQVHTSLWVATNRPALTKIICMYVYVCQFPHAIFDATFVAFHCNFSHPRLQLQITGANQLQYCSD